MNDVIVLTEFQRAADVNADLRSLLLSEPALRDHIRQAGQIFHADEDVPADLVFLLDDLEIFDLHDVGCSTKIHHHRDLTLAVFDKLPEVSLRRRVASVLRHDRLDLAVALRDPDHLDSGIECFRSDSSADFINMTVRTGADFLFDGPVRPEGFHLTDCIHRRLSRQFSIQVSGQFSGQVSDQVSDQVSGQFSGQVSRQFSGQVSGQFSRQISRQFSGQVSGHEGGFFAKTVS